MRVKAKTNGGDFKAKAIQFHQSVNLTLHDALRYWRGLDPITPIRSSSAISPSVIPSISAKTCQLCSPSIGAGTSARSGLSGMRATAPG